MISNNETLYICYFMNTIIHRNKITKKQFNMVSRIIKFLENTLDVDELYNVIFLSLMYFTKIKDKIPKNLDIGLLFVILCILALKWISDSPHCKMSCISRVLNIDVSCLKTYEISILKSIDYKLHIKNIEFQEFRTGLCLHFSQLFEKNITSNK
jgi:hypothetical protein